MNELEKEIKKILDPETKIIQDDFDKTEYQVELLIAVEPTVLTFNTKDKTINTDKKLFKMLNLEQKKELTKTVLNYLFNEGV